MILLKITFNPHGLRYSVQTCQDPTLRSVKSSFKPLGSDGQKYTTPFIMTPKRLGTYDVTVGLSTGQSPIPNSRYLYSITVEIGNGSGISGYRSGQGLPKELNIIIIRTTA